MMTYHEPNKFPAALLALLVHGAFFALLYFGIAWQSQPGGTMNVELWQSLPEGGGVALPAPPAAEAAPPPKVEEVPPPPAKVEEVPQPEIALPDKKKKEPVKKEQEVERKPPAPKWAAVARADSKPENKWGAVDNVRAPTPGARQATSGQADRTAMAGSAVDEYSARISAKIRSNIVVTQAVPDDAKAVFAVTVLPGGSVLPPKLVRSSGNAAYDSAVERAILKSQPLPLPPNVELYNRFRELELVFSPKDSKKRE